MIDEKEIECLSSNLTELNAGDFFQRNADQLVYFYYISDLDWPAVDTLRTFEKGELVIPTRLIKSNTFAVAYTNKKLAYSQIECDFKVAISKLHEFVNIVRSTKSVDGIFIQGNNCWFTIGLDELEYEHQ